MVRRRAEQELSALQSILEVADLDRPETLVPMSLSLRRIFHQVRDLSAQQMRGADLGFTGMAARVPIDDDYQADRLRVPRGSEQRLRAAQGFFMKRHRNAVRLADEHGDEEIRALIIGIREALADHLVVVAHQIRRELEHLGYSTITEEQDEEAAAFDAEENQEYPRLNLVHNWPPRILE